MTEEVYNHFVSLGLPKDIAQMMAEETNLPAPLDFPFRDATEALWSFACWDRTTQGHDFWSDFTRDWQRGVSV